MARKDSKKSKKRILSETKVNDISTESEKSIDESNGLLKSFTGNRKMVSVFLFVLSFLVFIPSLGNDFVWDDVTYIQNKADKLNLSSIKSELIPLGSTENKTGGNYYRPVYLATLILDNEIWNTSPLGFHLTNIILHSISTVLLYFLVLILLGEFKILGRESIALITSTLFALYPLHVESVSFVSARGDILAAIFFFLSLIFYIFSYKKLFYLLLSALCFFLSLLSKEVAIALPLVVISFDLISRRIMSRVNLVKYLVLSLMTLIYFLMRSKSHTSIVELINSGSAQISAGFLHLADVILNTYLFYFIKMVFPYNLNPFIDSVPDWGLLGLILSILLLLALCIAFFMSVRKKENLTAFSILWILATLIPAAVVVILPLALTNYAERFLYIPSAGICVLFAYIIYESGKRFKLELPSLVLTLVIAVSFAVVTLGAQKVWRNNLSLWERAVSTSPDSPGVKINYGDALRNSGNPSESLKNYLSAYENRAGLNTRAIITIAHSIAVAYI
jgi:hypothetical protein